MWQQGYLDARQMSGAFQFLRSNDLIWSRMVHDYLMGERQPLFDLMAWNANSTRMPYRMHSDYLRQMFLGNDLAEGRYRVEGRPVALTRHRVPVFAVATETDHVAPWRSVFKLHLLLDTDVTFLLTNGGHNAGIVSPPGYPSRAYRVHGTSDRDGYLDPDSWLGQVPIRQGSWWPEWVKMACRAFFRGGRRHCSGWQQAQAAVPGAWNVRFAALSLSWLNADTMAGGPIRSSGCCTQEPNHGHPGRLHCVLRTY